MCVVLFPRLRLRLSVSSGVVLLLGVMVGGVLSLLVVVSVVWRFLGGVVCFSGVLSWLGVVVLLVVMVCSLFCLSWCGGVACSFVVVVCARVAVSWRVVGVGSVPCVLGWSSFCGVAGGCVWLLSAMAKMVYASCPSWWLLFWACSAWVFVMWVVWFPCLWVFLG